MTPRPQISLLILVFTILTIPNAMAQQFKALLFADAYDEWHYRNVPVAHESFKELAELHYFELTFVDRAKDFAKQTFADYDILVFISANPCDLDEEKRTELQTFVQNGGAIVGVHSASAVAQEPNRWPWWEAAMGRVFLHHPAQQSAVMTVEEPCHESCMHLPEKWLWTDEWYEFETPFPEHLNVVLTVDEKTYKPGKHPMGEFHPIAWYHEYDGGRVFYTAIGHIAAAYRNEAFLQHIYGGMLWALGDNVKRTY